MRAGNRRIVASQAIGQLALVAVLPFLTRLVPTAELGIYQTAFAIGILLQPIATLRIEFFVPAISSTTELIRTLRIGRWCLTGVLVVGALVMAGLFLSSRTKPAELVASAGVILAAYAFTALDNSRLIHAGHTATLANRNLTAGLLAAAAQLITAVVHPASLLLGISILFGRLVAIALFRPKQPTMGSAVEPSSTHTRNSWSLRRSLTAVLSGTASIGALQILIFYAVTASGPAAAAQVGIAQRSANAPLGLVSQGLSQVSQSEFAPLIRSRSTQLGQEFRRQMRRLLPFSIAAIVALAVAGPLLAVPIFGPGWQQAGWYIALLSVPCGLQLLLAPAMSIFVMVGAERQLLVLQVGRLVGSVVAAAACQALFGSFLWAVAGFAAASTVFYAAVYSVLARVLARTDLENS